MCTQMYSMVEMISKHVEQGDNSGRRVESWPSVLVGQGLGTLYYCTVGRNLRAQPLGMACGDVRTVPHAGLHADTPSSSFGGRSKMSQEKQKRVWTICWEMLGTFTEENGICLWTLGFTRIYWNRLCFPGNQRWHHKSIFSSLYFPMDGGACPQPHSRAKARLSSNDKRRICARNQSMSSPGKSYCIDRWQIPEMNKWGSKSSMYNYA